MARALIDESNAEWVPEGSLISDGDPEVSYQIRPVSVETHRRFMKQFTKKVPNRRTHRPDEEVDAIAVSDAIYDYCLIGWKGVLVGGKPAPIDGIAPDGISLKMKLPGPLMSEIGAWAMQSGGAHGRSPEERRESFRGAE